MLVGRKKRVDRGKMTACGDGLAERQERLANAA